MPASVMIPKKSTEKTKSAAVGEVLAKPALIIASMSAKPQRPPATIASASKDGHSMNAMAGSILLLVSEMTVAAMARMAAAKCGCVIRNVLCMGCGGVWSRGGSLDVELE